MQFFLLQSHKFFHQALTMTNFKMNLIVSIVCLILVIHQINCERSSYQSCGSSRNAKLNVQKLNLPASFRMNTVNIVDANIKLTDDILPNDIVSMEIRKYQFPFGLSPPAPCIMGMGSCKTSFNKWFDKATSMTCQILKEFNLDCKPHIKKGDYQKQMKLRVNSDIVPYIFRGLIPVSLLRLKFPKNQK